MRRHLLASLVTLFAAVLPAQNVVKNGDFESGFAPWKASGFMITPRVEKFDVTGAGATMAFGWTPSRSGTARYATIEQDLTPVTVPTEAYELVVDVAVAYPESWGSTKLFRVQADMVGFTLGSVLARSFDIPNGNKGDVVRRRFSIGNAVPSGSGGRRLVIGVTSDFLGVHGQTPRLYIDNVIVRKRRRPFIGITGPLTVAGPITIMVLGTPGVDGVVWLSPSLLANPIKIPGFTGEIQIDPAVGVPALFGVFSSGSGLLSFQFKNLPPSIAGVRFYLQAVEFNAIRKVAGLGWHQVLTISK